MKKRAQTRLTLSLPFGKLQKLLDVSKKKNVEVGKVCVWGV